MRRNPYLFSNEEYTFLHHIYLKQSDESKLYKKIKTKRGIDLDKSEVKYVKRRYEQWRTSQGNENPIFFINNSMQRP